jgi:hypothetical protein
MTIYIQRKIQSLMAPGYLTDMGRVKYAEWSHDDIDTEKVLQISDDEGAWDYIELEASGSEALKLPEGYDNSNRLVVFIRTTGNVDVVTASPDHSTSTIALNGTSTFRGVMMFCSTVTSINISNNSGANRALVRYFMHELPDITDSASFRGGAKKIGHTGALS